MSKTPMAVCHNHKEYLTPLIMTMAWNGYEFWCPYCDKHYAFFSPDPAETTDELLTRHDLYDAAATEYLHAITLLVCSATLIDGERVYRGEWSDEYEAKHAAIREKGWELERKAEEL